MVRTLHKANPEHKMQRTEAKAKAIEVTVDLLGVIWYLEFTFSCLVNSTHRLLSPSITIQAASKT